MYTYYVTLKNGSNDSIMHRYIKAENRPLVRAIVEKTDSNKLTIESIRKLSKKENESYMQYVWLIVNSDTGSKAYDSLLARVEKSLTYIK